MNKVIVAIVLIVAVIIGYNIFFSDSKIEKELKNSLPYDLVTVILDDFDDEDSLLIYEEPLQTLEVKEFTVERYVKNGNNGEADCIIVLENECLKKTMDVCLFITKYNNGWQVDSWYENENSIVVPKYEPEITKVLNSIKYGYSHIGLSTLSVTEDYSSGLFEQVYSVNDEYEYVTFVGEITVNGEFIEDFDDELYSYSWDCYAEYDVEAQWNVVGTWELQYRFADYTPKYIATINIDSLYGDVIYGNATLKWPKNNGINYTGEYGTDYDDSLTCEVAGIGPETARLEIRSSCGSLEFTPDNCEGLVRLNEAQSIKRK